MKFFQLVLSLISVVFQCTAVYAAVDAQASCPNRPQYECASYTKEKMIYHQTMTPLWLEAHASYIDSSHSKTKEQLTFNANSIKNSALLKVPMIPAGVLHYTAPLTVKIVASHDVRIGTNEDSDIVYGVSDGISFIGFVMYDKDNYSVYPPCYGVQGSSGRRWTAAVYFSSLPRPSQSFYPGQFVLTLKLDERWGSCYTAHDGGFMTTAGYDNRLMLNKGLTLEVYKQGKDERVEIKFIEVTIVQDA